jgi:zinc protease
MTRDDLFRHYRSYYTPNNAVLVIVGDVEADAALRRVERHFGGIEAGSAPQRQRTLEPQQTGERRVAIRKDGSTAYLKVAYHAPAIGDPLFFPMLALDAVLTGAKGLNLWSSFRDTPPQRSARLYRALVERGVASSISGALLPTEHPFLYYVSATVTTGTSLGSVETILLEELDDVRRNGVTPAELEKAKTQLKARFIFDNDSISSIAHQMGYFETIADVDVFTRLAASVDAVTLETVAEAARVFGPSNRTVGSFDPDGRELKAEG